MGEQSRAFSFVDRITSLEAGVHATGAYAIPADLPEFPHALVAEATGQNAAWSAIAAVDFKFRPVAGIAGQIELLDTAHPGDLLELEANLQRVDTESVAYGGEARVKDRIILRLHDCVGPMLPMSDFDDPASVRNRFEMLRRNGAVPGEFGGLPALDCEHIASEPGQSITARCTVPASAVLFTDHFPRRPVFPGTLLVHLNLRLARELAATIPAPRPWRPVLVRDVKLRSFVAPGAELEMTVKRTDDGAENATMSMETRSNGRTISRAKVVLQPE